MKCINYLHFSDLHYGLKDQSILMPKMKDELFKDLSKISTTIGPWDYVFFTGDLTQKGSIEEFKNLTFFLKELWQHFNLIGCNPILICIPGNHDLVRPDDFDPRVKALKSWHSDNKLREGFWNNKDNNPYLDLINKCFKNYTEWYQNLEIPKPENITKGFLPGDYSCIIERNEIRLGVVCLNTAYLQLTDDNYERKIDLNLNQITSLCDNDHIKWHKDTDISLLLTHHSPSWFHKSSIETYKSEILGSNTFYNHFCGHLHKPEAFQITYMGSEPRNIQVVPSLFGLERIGNKLERIHGYFSGRFELNSELIESFWPRKMFKKYDGSFSLDPDNGFKLNDQQNCIRKSSIKKIFSNNDDQKTETTEGAKSLSENILSVKEESFDKYKEELNTIPSTKFTITLHHKSIRKEEQLHFLNVIKSNRVAWLVTDWGLGEDGFIGSVMENINAGNILNNCFQLNCEDFNNIDQIKTGFEEQFHLSLQKYCQIINSVQSALLVFNQVNPTLFKEYNNLNNFNEILNTIKDYCPNLYLIIVTRQIPNNFSDSYIKLCSLDLLQTRAYTLAHPNGSSEYEDSIIIEKIHKYTSGLPNHIDKTFNNLKYTSLDDLIENEDNILDSSENVDLIPKSLIESVNKLLNSNNDVSQKSYKLLKILTILANGETLNRIKRIEPNNCYYPNNVEELEQLSLIEIINDTQVVPVISEKYEIKIQKIIRVPRQVRDYINTLITEKERIEIVNFAFDLLFGEKWRAGKIKQIEYSALSKNKPLVNGGNEHIVAKLMLNDALGKVNTLNVERISNVCISYCRNLYENNMFKDALFASEEIFHLLKHTNYIEQKAFISRIYGESLRMTGDNKKALEILSETINSTPQLFSNEQKAMLYWDIAYAHEKLGNENDAIIYSKKILSLSKEDSSMSIAAEAIIISNDKDIKKHEWIKKMKELESKARKLEYDVVANNIALKIAREPSESLLNRNKYINKVLGTKDDAYNVIRAIIDKGKFLLENKKISKLTESDLTLLSLSYSYLFYQRLSSLFNSCHQVLWSYLLELEKQQELLNLYRYSSFVWRINGEIKLENKYFWEYKNSTFFDLDNIVKSPINDFNKNYFKNRFDDFTDANNNT